MSVCFANEQTKHCEDQNGDSKVFKIPYNYLSKTGTLSFNESITIGFLGAYGKAQVVLGALPLAVEAVNKNAGLY